MNKKNILYIFVKLIFIIVFNVVFFLIGGTNHTTSVWIAYGFIHGAYLLILVTPLLTKGSKYSHVFNLTMYTISSVYFIVEFTVGVLFILINTKSYKATLIIQIILLSIYLMIFIFNWISNETTADNIKKQEIEVAYIKNTSARIKNLIGKVNNKFINKELEKIYDVLHSSPSCSNNNVKYLEMEIKNQIDELEKNILTNSEDEILAKIKELAYNLEERNRQLKLYN